VYKKLKATQVPDTLEGNSPLSTDSNHSSPAREVPNFNENNKRTREELDEWISSVKINKVDPIPSPSLFLSFSFFLLFFL